MAEIARRTRNMNGTNIYLRSLLMETPIARRIIRLRKMQMHSDPNYAFQIIDKKRSHRSDAGRKRRNGCGYDQDVQGLRLYL